MARRRSSLRYPGGRDILKSLSLAPLPRRISVRSTKQLMLDNARLLGQDNRAFTPTRMIRPAQTVTGRIALTGVSRKRPLNRLKVRFALPRETTICVRRGVRKEVLHAYRKTGKNGGKHYRRNFYSNISC